MLTVQIRAGSRVSMFVRWLFESTILHPQFLEDER